eukprot:5415228-Prymnesium_polylepis.1
MWGAQGPAPLRGASAAGRGHGCSGALRASHARCPRVRSARCVRACERVTRGFVGAVCLWDRGFCGALRAFSWARVGGTRRERCGRGAETLPRRAPGIDSERMRFIVT